GRTAKKIKGRILYEYALCGKVAPRMSGIG
ncbi:MAG: hypothetical protein QG552_1727, partial [Thermodesulfobacteriota bacterium]|nr:hypothetical protein [Thermodesulfobacteriota bacterium]